jgi:hypothetical protein
LDKKHHPFQEDFPLQNIHDLGTPNQISKKSMVTLVCQNIFGEGW